MTRSSKIELAPIEYLYRPTLRPASFCTVPRGLKWDYIETPRDGSVNRPDLPRSNHPFGIIATERQLTRAEMSTFDLEQV
jgi:hypothetical protein